MDVRTRLAIEALEARCKELEAAYERLHQDALLAADRATKLEDRLTALENRVGDIKVSQGFHKFPIEVPPPPKILRDIGLLPPERSTTAGDPTADRSRTSIP